MAVAGFGNDVDLITATRKEPRNEAGAFIAQVKCLSDETRSEYLGCLSAKRSPSFRQPGRVVYRVER